MSLGQFTHVYESCNDSCVIPELFTINSNSSKTPSKKHVTNGEVGWSRTRREDDERTQVTLFCECRCSMYSPVVPWYLRILSEGLGTGGSDEPHLPKSRRTRGVGGVGSFGSFVRRDLKYGVLIVLRDPITQLPVGQDPSWSCIGPEKVGQRGIKSYNVGDV